MFTGIVQGRATVTAVEDLDGLRRLWLALPAGRGAGLVPGASVSVAGVCLTVVEVDGDAARFDLIDETLRRTSLGALGLGDTVNVERAARFGDEIGGHLLSGHVLGCARLVERLPSAHNLELRLAPPDEARRFLMTKGYVGIDGCSLTIGAVQPDGSFSVHLIPETLRLTTLGDKRVGDLLNLEVDALTQAVVERAEQLLAARGLL
jgi:riboflavin synthase